MEMTLELKSRTGRQPALPTSMLLALLKKKNTNAPSTFSFNELGIIRKFVRKGEKDYGVELMLISLDI
jgi:hypothetical protein